MTVEKQQKGSTEARPHDNDDFKIIKCGLLMLLCSVCLCCCGVVCLWESLPRKTFQFSIQEFCLITGLACGPDPLVLGKEKGDGSGSFSSSMLNGEVHYNNKTLEAIFKAASSDNDEDMVKLALLYFLETVLFGKD
ncbi:hypothetical protein Dsin_027893 [Dipteronia sinensis]|uniref:DUF1985 domain-containing protein n=1 Tax=Dipteronia sinensis TaxID=43782 RepID=A0AAD9ZQS1_9ROSI|nr:hypothetical protein Dsin_027893 [Dipteronia sinensis]